MKYIHLHNHSEASIADGLFGVKKWVGAIEDKGFVGQALTDHGVMTNALPFYTQMKAAGLIPIIGAEFYYVDEPLVKSAENRKNSHLILIAKNYEGYQNLCKLSKLSFTEGYYYKNRIGRDWLAEYSNGLVCLTACQGGVLSQEVWKETRGAKSDLEGKFKELHAIFGKDLYVEFQGHNTINLQEDGTEFNSQALINMAFYDKLRHLPGFQQIVTNDCHYILPEHAMIQKKIKEMMWKGGKSDAAGESATVTKDHFTDSLWLKGGVQVYEAFRKHHEYLPKQFVADGMRNTFDVLEKCKDFEFPKRRYLPTFRAGVDSKALFVKLTTAKMRQFLKKGKLHDHRSVYVRRFKEELRVISTHNLEDYFLVVWDIIRFAERGGIYSGLGRGSAAGSLISYILGIVKIDPIEYGLIFERFLNENRCVSGELPDIDLDFESDRRKEIKDYIYKTYGHDKVCEIGTYGRMKLKTCLIDFAKAFGIASQKEILSITTSLDLDKEDVDDLEAAAESDPKLMKLLASHEDFGFTVTETIGQIKSQGVHPAGVIICSDIISDITPIKTQRKTKKDAGEEDSRIITTQFEDKHIISQGMMKMDVLGLKEYDVIRFVIENTKTGLTANYAEELQEREREEPNEAVWSMFKDGKSEGVFQFASDGMKALLVMMQPDCINDLVAANALYRPGCLENGWHIQYCKRKNGEEEVTYDHPFVEKALGTTYGVIVFQEQFMEVIHKLGDISLVESDTIRSALGKKDLDKLHKFQEKFVKGAAPKIGKERAIELWQQIEKASGYSFNRSHSAAYSVLAYISQYLKVNHTAHFWAAQLDWDVRKNKLEDMLTNRRAASDMGVEFVLPDINLSKERFTVTEGETEIGITTKRESVVWSITSVKGVGPKAAREIISKQPYKGFEDFHKRVNKSIVKANNIESLIYAGAFDSFGDRRNLLDIMAAVDRAKKGKKAKPYKRPTEEEMVMKFYDSMGFLEIKLKSIKEFSKGCITESELREYGDGDYARVGGMITAARNQKTRRGDAMGFVTMVDLDEMIELTVFPEAWAKFRSVLREGKIVEVYGKKSVYGNRQNQLQLELAEEIL